MSTWVVRPSSMRRLDKILILTLLAAISVVPCLAGATTHGPFALTVHVATEDQDATSMRLERLLETANESFAAAEISFEISEQKELPESYAVLDTIRERRKLKKFFVPKTINVYLVDEILDPNPSAATVKACKQQGRKPSGRLAGAHIPINNKKPGTYIVLSKHVDQYSLTHELGHFFGVAHHKEPKNIMSYGGDRSEFDEKQLETFRRKAKRYRKKRIVKIVEYRSDKMDELTEALADNKAQPKDVYAKTVDDSHRSAHRAVYRLYRAEAVDPGPRPQPLVGSPKARHRDDDHLIQRPANGMC